MEKAILKNLTFQNLIARASNTRCELESIEAEIFERMRARANKHKASRVRAEKRANQQAGK